MASVNFQNVNLYQVPESYKKITGENNVVNKNYSSSPSFGRESYKTNLTLRTELANKDEKKKYNTLMEELDAPYRRKLEYALKSGQLLKNNSNDKSTVLDNLYKIMNEERDEGLDNLTILKECLDIISNPYIITQTCEDIPTEYQKQIIGLITGLSTNKNEIEKTKFELNHMHTGTCPAASIEFDLATKQTAEFFRMVEGLTSPKNEVKKTIRMSSLSDKSSDVVYLLNVFKTPYKKVSFNEAEVILKPDKNAIIRARIQNNHRDKGERSIIDVIMQSTFMQLGSQQTYDSLTDKRAPNDWTQEDGGLIDFEKTYVESVVEDKNTTSVTYQEVSDDGKLKGYTKDFKTIKKEILDTLNMGQNVIIGYTWPDPENNGKLAGHEITIVAYKTKPNGEGVFICQDSDDNKDAPIEMTESYLIPKIHHAGLPDKIASKDFEYKDSWEFGVNEYQKNN